MPPGPRTIAADAIPIEEPTIKFPLQPASALVLAAQTESGETDTGDPATLFDFISWTQEHYPADRYMVILAGHGAGTEEDFLMSDENPGEFSQYSCVAEGVGGGEEETETKLTSSEWTSV